jgi:hypothetical protein
VAILGVWLLALAVGAGSVVDSDADTIPDVFGSCPFVPNGPGDGSDQIDADEDDFGNPCDCDDDQNGFAW